MAATAPIAKSGKGIGLPEIEFSRAGDTVGIGWLDTSVVVHHGTGTKTVALTPHGFDKLGGEAVS
jgi:hypothetical protein